MDFEVTVNDKRIRTTQFNDVMDFIRSELAYWNNFESEKPTSLMVYKVPSGTQTIGVNVKDDVDAQDLFGRR